MQKYDYDQQGCRNCGTRRYPERQSGYCPRCYYKVRKLSALERGVWKSRSKHPRKRYDVGYQIYRTEKDLRVLRELGNPFFDDYIDPLLLEGLLFSLINATRAYVPNFPYGLTTVLYNELSPNENLSAYRSLYRMLLSIVENLPQHRHRKISGSLWFTPAHCGEAYSEYEEFCKWKEARNAKA